MTIKDLIKQFFDTPTGTAMVLVFALSVLKFGLGVFAAFRDNVFQLDAIGAWLRKDLAGRVLPILLVLFIGYLTGGLTLDDGIAGLFSPGTILTGIGIAAAGVYVLEIVGSVRESLTPKPAAAPPEETVRNVPTD